MSVLPWCLFVGAGMWHLKKPAPYPQPPLLRVFTLHFVSKYAKRFQKHCSGQPTLLNTLHVVVVKDGEIGF